MQHTAIFEEQVALTPKDMRGGIESIDTLLEEKIRTRLEGRCSKHGYVVPGTIKILSRSMGYIEKGRFTGSFLYYVQAEGSVLNPPDGIVVEGEVIRKNKMGMYVSYQDAIRIIIPRDLHIGDESFEAVEIGERIRVEIKKSRFQVNDSYILSVGFFRGSTGAYTSRRTLARVAEAPEVEEQEGNILVESELESDAEKEMEEEEIPLVEA